MAEHPDLPRAEWHPDKGFYLQAVFEAFPECRAQYNKRRSDYEKLNEAKRRFNGSVVSTLTGLNGKALGDFMVVFKRQHSAQLDSLDDYTDEALHELVRSFNRKASGTPHDQK